MVGVSRRLTLFFSFLAVLVFCFAEPAFAKRFIKNVAVDEGDGLNDTGGGGGGGRGGGSTTTNYTTKPVLVDDWSGYNLAKRATAGCTSADAETDTLDILSNASGLSSSNFAHRYTLDPTLTEANGAEAQLFIVRYDQVVNNPNGGRTPIKDSHIIAKWKCNESGQPVLRKMEGEVVDSSRVIFNGLTDLQARQAAFDELRSSPEYSDITLDALEVESRITEFIPGSGADYGFVEKINVVLNEGTARAAAVSIYPSEPTGTRITPQIAGLDYNGTVSGMAVTSGPIHAGATFEPVPLEGIILLDASWNYVGQTGEDGIYGIDPVVSSTSGISFQVGLGTMPTNVADSELPYIRVSMPSGGLCWIGNNPGGDGSYGNDCSYTVPSPGTDPLELNILANHNPNVSTREKMALETTASYHANHARSWVKTLFGDQGDMANFPSPDLTDQDTKMIIRPDSTVAGTCNAEYDYNINELRLGRDGAGSLTVWDEDGEEASLNVNCLNATFDSVIYHEFGHALHDWFGGTYDQGSMTNDGLSEGWSDIMSSFLLDNPRISEGIVGSGADAGNNYVRTVDSNYQLANADTVYKYGLVWASIGWHTRRDLIQLGRYENGEAGADAAKEVAAEIFMLSMADLPTTIEDAVVRVLEVDALRTTPSPCVILNNAEAHGVDLSDARFDPWANAEQCLAVINPGDNLNDAIDAAANNPGVVVQLAPGTHTLNPASVGPSFITGDSNGSSTVLTITGDPLAPDQYVIQSGGLGIRNSTLKLRGVTMQNADPSAAASYGRAVFGENATLMIDNSIFKNNAGGAVYNTATIWVEVIPDPFEFIIHRDDAMSRTVIRNSSFVQNGSRQDLALIPGYTYPVDVQPLPYPALDSIIPFYTDRYENAPNQAHEWTVDMDTDGSGPNGPVSQLLTPGKSGAAVYHFGGDLQISNSYFLFNQAVSGAALHVANDFLAETTSNVENNVFFGNLSFERGHCAVDSDESGTFCKPAHLRSNYGEGAAMLVQAQNFLANHNTIVNNEGGVYGAGIEVQSCTAKFRNSIIMFNRSTPNYCSDGTEWGFFNDDNGIPDGACGYTGPGTWGDPDSTATVQLHGLAPFVADLHYPSHCSTEELAEAVQYIAIKHEYRPQGYGLNWNNPDAPPATPWPGAGMQVGGLRIDDLGHLVRDHRLQPGDADYPALHNYFAQDLRLCDYSAGSSALNRGNNAYGTLYDIRGLQRLGLDGFVDLGAYETRAADHTEMTNAGYCDNPPPAPQPYNEKLPHVQDYNGDVNM